PLLISSLKSSVRVLFTSTRRLEMVPVVKPDLLNLSEYGPGVTLARTYWPEELVSVERDSFVAAFTNSTVTPGATAPAGSVIVPWTAPVAAVCAPAGALRHTKATNTASKRESVTSFRMSASHPETGTVHEKNSAE